MLLEIHETVGPSPILLVVTTHFTAARSAARVFQGDSGGRSEAQRRPHAALRDRGVTLEPKVPSGGGRGTNAKRSPRPSPGSAARSRPVDATRHAPVTLPYFDNSPPKQLCLARLVLANGVTGG